MVANTLSKLAGETLVDSTQVLGKYFKPAGLGWGSQEQGKARYLMSA